MSDASKKRLLDSNEERIQALSRLIEMFDNAKSIRKSTWFRRELVALTVELIQRKCPIINQHLDLIKLMDQVCEAFKIDFTNPVHSSPPPDWTSQGWRDLQLGILWDAVIMSVTLKDKPSEFKYRLKLSELVHQQESEGVQVDQRLKYETQRLSDLLKSLRGHDLGFWAPKDILLAIELVPLSARRLPVVCQPRLTVNSNSLDQPRSTPSFVYYNHSRSVTSANTYKALLKVVKNEPVTVLATVQNPLSFELDIPMIQLSASGVKADLEPSSVWIPPKTLKVIELRGFPRESGRLTFRGCHVRLMECSQTQELILPVGKGKGTTNSKTKGQVEEARMLTCEVVDSMPYLTLVGGTADLIEAGGYTIYEGETRNIELHLKNVSPVKIDWIEVEPHDSLSDKIRQQLQQLGQPSDNVLYRPQLDRYKLEFELVRRPVLSPEPLGSIEAAAVGKLKVRCLGKVDCQKVGLKIGYGVHDSNQKRQLELEFHLSVRRAVEVVGFKILGMGTVVMKVKNQCRGGQVFELEIQARQQGDNDLDDLAKGGQKRLLRAGTTETIFVKLKRFFISEENLEKPIPTLISRQFVVEQNFAGQGKVLKEEARTHWIQERFFDSIRVRWKEIGTNRNGEINLRNLHIDESQLHQLREHEIKVEMGIETTSSACSRKDEVEIDDFNPLTVRLLNQSSYLRCVVLELQVEKVEHPTRNFQGIEPLFMIDGLGECKRSLNLQSSVWHEEEHMVGFLSCGKFRVNCKVTCQRPDDQENDHQTHTLEVKVVAKKKTSTP